MREYELEFEVNSDTSEFTVKYWFTIHGEDRPAIMYPNDQAQPAEYANIEITGIHMQISGDEWIEVDHKFFDDWASDNEELFFEGIKDDD